MIKHNKLKLNLVKMLILTIVTTPFFTGCGTLGLQTNVKMTKSVFLKPENAQDRSIYISLKSMTGDHLDILPLLKKNLHTKNYTIVDNAKDAHYVLMVNILFANNLKEAYALRNGAALGATTGIIAAASGSNTGDSILIGAAVALAGGLVSNALEDETYRAVVDVVVDEKSKYGDGSIMGQDYKEHKTRILAEAVQTNLKLNEALPILSNKVATQLSNIF